MEVTAESTNESMLSECVSQPNVELDTLFNVGNINENQEENDIQREVSLSAILPEFKPYTPCERKTKIFQRIGKEAKHLKTMLLSVGPEINTLYSEMSKLYWTLSLSGVKNDSTVKRFFFELDHLKRLTVQFESELKGMMTDVESLLDCAHPTPGSAAASKKVTEHTKQECVRLNVSPISYQHNTKMTKSPDRWLGKRRKKLLPSMNMKSSIPNDLRCDFCRVECEDYFKLKEHFKLKHPNQDPFVCSVCGSRFKEKYCQLRCQHECNERKINKGKYKCETCSEMYCSKVLLRLHVEHAHGVLSPNPAVLNVLAPNPAVLNVLAPNPPVLNVLAPNPPVLNALSPNPPVLNVPAPNPPAPNLLACDPPAPNLLASNAQTPNSHANTLPAPNPPALKITCILCDKVFIQTKDLHDHMDIHVGTDGIWNCPICPTHRRFHKRIFLIRHLVRHSKSLACKICGKTVLSAASLRLHQATHFEKLPCHLCGRRMSSAKTLKEHMNTHTGEKPYECEICHEKLFSKCALYGHKSRYHSEHQAGNKCLICGKWFRSCVARNSHLMTHTEEERNLHKVFVPMYTCDVCGKTVRIEYKTYHIKQHMSKSEKSFVCETCGQSFSLYSKLKFHKMTEHMLKEKGDKDLTKEEQEFLKKKLSVRLKQVKVKHKPFPCNVCSRYFSSEALVKYHMRVHTGNFSFKCEVCGKGFMARLQLETHMVSHTKIKPYACNQCDLKLSSLRNLLRHIKVKHEKHKPFKCETCGRSFARKRCLLVHTRIHTGEKPYLCHLCGSSFADPGSFYKHKVYHAKNPLKRKTTSDTVK